MPALAMLAASGPVVAWGTLIGHSPRGRFPSDRHWHAAWLIASRALQVIGRMDHVQIVTK